MYHPTILSKVKEIIGKNIYVWSSAIVGKYTGDLEGRRNGALISMATDESLEITPKSLRLRKSMLNPNDRKRKAKS